MPPYHKQCRGHISPHLFVSSTKHPPHTRRTQKHGSLCAAVRYGIHPLLVDELRIANRCREGCVERGVHGPQECSCLFLHRPQTVLDLRSDGVHGVRRCEMFVHLIRLEPA